MTITRKRPYGPVDEQRLVTFEKRLPAELPPAYRAFLLEFNGATIKDAENLDEVVGGTCVGNLYGLHDGPTYLRLDDVRDSFENAAPPSLLVIGADPFGNYFAMELVGPRGGAVFFVDHERLPVDVTALMQVAPSFTALLERIGADVAPPEPPISLADAIKQGDAEAVGVLLRGGVDATGFVHAALRTGNLEIVSLVLEHRGDPNERGGIGGETPLFVAARENRPDIVQLLLARGADPDARCNAGGTAMEMAAPWPRVLEILVRAGATPTTNRLRDAVRRILGT
jgi:hypothetical protein